MAPITYGRRRHFQTDFIDDYVSLYSLLAYTDHYDIWFAYVPTLAPSALTFHLLITCSRELRDLGVMLTCPWETHPFHDASNDKRLDKYVYISPLMHAMGTHFWPYVLWLLDSGASVEEKINPSHTVLSALMGTRSVELIEFFFRGCQNHEKGAAYLPSQYREAGGYYVFRLFYDARNVMLTIEDSDDRVPDWDLSETMKDTALQKELEKRREEQESQRQDATVKCFKYLLRKYPDAENTLPKYPAIYWLPRYHLSIVHQAAALSSSSRNADVLLLLVKFWTARQRPFPKQQLIHYIYGSPLNRFEGSQISKVLRAGNNLTLRHLAPSAQWMPIWEIYLWTVLCAIAVLILQWLIGPVDSWNLETGNRFTSSVILGVTFLVAAGFIGRCVYIVVHDIQHVINLRTHFDKFFLLVAAYLTTPILILTGIALRGFVDAASIKGRSGYFLIPYVF